MTTPEPTPTLQQRLRCILDLRSDLRPRQAEDLATFLVPGVERLIEAAVEDWRNLMLGLSAALGEDETRPECHVERAGRQGGDESPAACDCSETTRAPGAPILEQPLIDRVNALEVLVEDLLIYIERCGKGPGTVEYRRRLRDLTNDEGET